MLAPLLCGLLFADTQTVARGAAGYWSCYDTTLDSTQPDLNRGGDGFLEAGPGRTILVKFADLDRAIGPNRRIVSAKLVFVLAGVNKPTLRAISVVKAPWGEGPMRTLQALAPGTAVNETPRWSATWRNRRAGKEPIAWQQPGATGPGDVERIRNATLTMVGESVFEIGGLGEAVQRQYDRWYENNGFSLTFENQVEIYSADSGERPKLVLETEPITPAPGADLCVTYIERTPEFERYDDRDASTVKNGVPFMDKPANATAQKWPFDGADMTYTAHIKNVGNATAGPFVVQWIIGEIPGGRVDVTQSLAPGEETKFALKKPFRNQHSDHRIQPLAFRLYPSAPDLNANNDLVEIQECGLSVGVSVSEANAARFPGYESWVQNQVRFWNSMAADSRYSFAPEGALERIRVARIHKETKTNLVYDAEVELTSLDEKAFQAQLTKQLGLPDLNRMNFDSKNLVGRGTEDRFSGLTRGGDTRNDAGVLGQIVLPQNPEYDRLFSTINFEVYGLLSMTEIAGLNSNLGKRRGFLGDVLYDTPTLTVVKCQSLDGRPLGNVELRAFQTKDGVLTDSNPVFTVKTGDNGTATLPNRPTEEPGSLMTLTGHTLRPNPFGRIDPLGGNGVLWIQATVEGVTDTAVLKVWQLVDAYHRGSKGVALFDLRFNVPSAPLNPAENLAQGKAATADGVALPALTDGNATTTATTEAPFIEIDLARDRPAGEIEITTGPDFWPKFDILIYQTGDKPEQARVWSKEADLGWTLRNKARDGVIPYRVTAQRFRYVRIVNRSTQKRGTLAEVRVIPVKPN